MEELPERSEFRRTQRERERERRRIRDRERRSSMTMEQRERHLARRRRNYQLRRLRSRDVRTTIPPFEQPSFSSPTEMGETNFHQTETSIAELDLQRNGLTFIGFNHEQEAINPDSIRCSGSEILDLKASSLQGRVRLNHIRRVARSIIHTSSERIGIHQILAQVGSVEEPTCNYMQIGDYDPIRTPKGLRLNRVKHLARMINSSVKASADPQHQTSIAGPDAHNAETKDAGSTLILLNHSRSLEGFNFDKSQPSSVFQRKRE